MVNKCFPMLKATRMLAWECRDFREGLGIAGMIRLLFSIPGTQPAKPREAHSSSILQSIQWQLFQGGTHKHHWQMALPTLLIHEVRPTFENGTQKSQSWFMKKSPMTPDYHWLKGYNWGEAKVAASPLLTQPLKSKLLISSRAFHFSVCWCFGIS